MFAPTDLQEACLGSVVNAFWATTGTFAKERCPLAGKPDPLLPHSIPPFLDRPSPPRACDRTRLRGRGLDHDDKVPKEIDFWPCDILTFYVTRCSSIHVLIS